MKSLMARWIVKSVSLLAELAKAGMCKHLVVQRPWSNSSTAAKSKECGSSAMRSVWPTQSYLGVLGVLGLLKLHTNKRSGTRVRKLHLPGYCLWPNGGSPIASRTQENDPPASSIHQSTLHARTDPVVQNRSIPRMPVKLC